MKNLLSGEWTARKIEAFLSLQKRRPLIPPMGAEEWKRVAQNPQVDGWKKAVRAKVEKEWDQPLPELADDLYAIFQRTGSRREFNPLYLGRRATFNEVTITLLLCREDDPWRTRFEKSLVDKLKAIFEEESWALPCHIENPTGKDPMMLDLCCAETAHFMAGSLDVFGEIIPASLQGRIRERLYRTIFENYLENSGKYWWAPFGSNWNAVCHQGIIGSALSQYDDTSRLAKMLELASGYLPAFMKAFGEDGGCSEGPGYWAYGFGRMAILNEQLETRTRGELSFFYGDEHARAISRFGALASLTGGKLINFSDCKPGEWIRPSLFAYLGNYFDDAMVKDRAAMNYRHFILHETEWIQHGHWSDTLAMFLLCPEQLPDAAPKKSEDVFFPNLEMLVARGEDEKGHLWDFAAKAGHNEEFHNHNDCGSYLLNVEGERLIIEIGAPEYDKEFFGPRRYENLAARSLGHSVPVINGCEQAGGRLHASKILEHSFDSAHAGFSLEAAATYPAEAGCSRFLRTFHLDKAKGRLSVRDVFELSRVESLEGAVITEAELTLEGDKAFGSAGVLRFVIRALPGTRFDRVEKYEYRDPSSRPASICRLVLKPEMLAARVELGFEIALA